jgi:ubiquinone/menaquinone biosynthesis C-methylase UbiE
MKARRVSVLLWCLALVASLARAASDDATSHRSFADVEHWVSVFDDPARDAYQKPEEVVRALRIRPGMRVADLGAGTGYFSRHLSTAVGASGTVLAVDTEPELVRHLRERAEKEKTDNVVPILASPDNPRLPRGAVDLVLLVDTFHHLDQRVAYFGRLRRTLAPGGRVAVVDWQKRETPIGPELEHRLAREQVVEEMRTAGYALVDEPDVLPYQYCLVFRPR